MNNLYNHHTIDAYLKGRLKGEELTGFEEVLQKDTVLQEAVGLQRDIMMGVQASVRNSLKKKLKQFHQQLPKQQEAINAAINSNEQSYTLEELLDMFKVVSHYEAAIEQANLAMAARSSRLEVIRPANQADCTHDLTFELSKAVSEVLHLTIEDSEEDEVYEGKFPLNTTVFTPIFDKALLPGRYYWKLMGSTYETTIGTFFIHKELKP